MGKVDYTFDDLVEITEWSLEQSPGSACRSNVLENWRRNQRLKLIIDEFVATIHCNNHYTAILHEGMQQGSDADRTVSISPQTVTDCWYLGEHGCTHSDNAAPQIQAADTTATAIDNNDEVRVTDTHTKRVRAAAFPMYFSDESDRDSDDSDTYGSDDASADRQHNAGRNKRRETGSELPFASPRRRKRHVMTEWQKDVMERWRREHEAEYCGLHPNHSQCAALARTAHMSLRQVEKHFDNFRQRHFKDQLKHRRRRAPDMEIGDAEIAEQRSVRKTRA